MQNTRLNRLVDVLLARFLLWARNPWRRTSLIIIGFLLGYFLANAISTISGQKAFLDMTVSFLMLLLTEAVNWLVYARLRQSSLFSDTLSAIKVGFVYGLFVEAFKLGS
ncbi:DUF565 domain-containing protein [Phormidium yuhuli AB48]|uniref:DUF565 domain-containing protein n=1 Tax=Phormidium yuhuli AB48 TaxID=2940671 RepID=A0ABY5AM38_9CYAN|nr:DUF565 domain-containing protein [Phormidium yuhuli]USR89993.1 DUF565 domain-containing protein [Phormidium yuhuli AB48]